MDDVDNPDHDNAELNDYDRHKGFILLHRKIMQWEWYSDHVCRGLFIHLLIAVRWKTCRWRGQLIIRGSMPCGLHQLSKDLSYSVQQLRTAISKLKSTNEITIKSGPKGSIITVVRYDDYQPSTSSSTNNQQTINKQSTTIEERKKEKKEKKVNNKKVAPAKAAATPKKTAGGISTETWKAYSQAYEQRYSDKPLRNKQTSSLLKQLVEKVGKDTAPELAKFYIFHTNSYYFSRGHPIQLLLTDYQKLLTEMNTGKKITRADIKTAEKIDHVIGLVESNPWREK